MSAPEGILFTGQWRTSLTATTCNPRQLNILHKESSSKKAEAMSSPIQNVLKYDFTVGLPPHSSSLPRASPTPRTVGPAQTAVYALLSLPIFSLYLKGRKPSWRYQPTLSSPIPNPEHFIIFAICFEMYLIKYHRMSGLIFFLMDFTYLSLV